MKTKYYLLIATTFLLFHNKTIAQTKKGYPDIGYSWDTLYKGESPKTIDSVIKWVNSIDTIHPELTIKGIIRVYGKYFFRHSDEELIDSLIHSIPYSSSFESYENPQEYFDDLEETLKTVPTICQNSQVFSRSIFEQIWDENYQFLVFDKFGWYQPYIDDSVNSSIIQEMYFSFDSLNPSDCLIPDFNKVIQNIDQQKNEKVRLDLYLLFLRTLHINYCRNHYIIQLSNKINNLLFSSNTLTNYQKAYGFVGLAKMIATISLEGSESSILPWFNIAEGYLSLDKNDSMYFQKVGIMKAHYFGSLPGIHYKNKAIDLLRQIYSEIKNWDDEIKERVILYETNSLLSLYRDNLNQYNYTLSDKEKLYLAICIASHNHFSEYDGFPFSDVGSSIDRLRQKTLAYYLELTQNYDFAIKLYSSLLGMYSNPFGGDNKFEVPNYVDRISRLYHDVGDYENHQLWNKYVNYNRDSGVRSRNTFIDDSIPFTADLWTKEYYLTRKEQIKKWLTFDEDSSRLNEKIDKFPALKKYVKTLAKYLAEDGNYKEAYEFSLKADSMSVYFNPSYFTFLGQLSYYSSVLPSQLQILDSIEILSKEKSNLSVGIKNLIKEKQVLKAINVTLQKEVKLTNDSLYDLKESLLELDNKIAQARYRLDSISGEVGGLQKIILQKDSLNRVVVKAKNKAIRNKNYAFLFAGLLFVVSIIAINRQIKYKVLAYTNNQLSHFAKVVPETIANRIRNAIGLNDLMSIEVERKKLTRLSAFFDNFYSNSTNTTITASDEIELLKELINIQYSEENKPNYFNEKVVITGLSASAFKLPTFSLINLVYNSFRWGQIQTDPLRKVEVNITPRFLGYKLTITDNGVGASAHKKKKKTGIKYVRQMIRFWNFFLFPKVKHGNRKDGKQGYQVSYSVLKRKR